MMWHIGNNLEKLLIETALSELQHTTRGVEETQSKILLFCCVQIFHQVPGF
jgi:hypothetical protein